jgi:hypothetical protein
MEDDAVHVVDPDERASTLCGQDRARCNTVDIDQPRPAYWGDGCWTCIEEAATYDAKQAAAESTGGSDGNG